MLIAKAILWITILACALGLALIHQLSYSVWQKIVASIMFATPIIVGDTIRLKM